MASFRFFVCCVCMFLLVFLTAALFTNRLRTVHEPCIHEQTCLLSRTTFESALKFNTLEIHVFENYFHHLLTTCWVSRPFQLAIYTAVRIEFEFAVRNHQNPSARRENSEFKI